MSLVLKLIYLWRCCDRSAMLCLLQLWDLSHSRISLGGCVGLGSRAQVFFQGQHDPSECVAVESRGSSTLTLQTQPWRLRATTTFSGRGKKQAVIISSMRWMRSSIPSVTAALVPGRSYYSFLLSHVFLFLCSSRSASLGPGGPRQSLSLGNVAQQHSPNKRQLKWMFPFSLFDWQLSAGAESCATNSAQEVLHR